MKIWEPKPPGNLWAAPGLLRDCFTFFSRLEIDYPFSCFTCWGGWERCEDF